jgi:hypothetical protein
MRQSDPSNRGTRGGQAGRSAYALRSHPPPGRARAEGESKMKEPARHASLPWTQAEDDNLRKLALAGASSGEIGHHLNRTISSVRSRARRLNIILKKDCETLPDGLKAKGK